MISFTFNRTLLALAASAMIVACETKPVKLPGGVSPVQATWLYGRYTLPANTTKSHTTRSFRQFAGEPAWTGLAEKSLKTGVKVPVVLFMHGCKGIGRQSELYRELLVSQGYAVFMPDSFQRPGRRKCRAQGSLSERVQLRTEEVKFALGEIRKLPWVKQDRIILMGFSEGGNTVDNWSRTGFAAHMIMGSACTLVGGEPAAPGGIPVLAIVGERDHFRPGLSCKITRTVGGSKSIVIPHADHGVADYPQTQEAIRTFLRQCCS